MGRHIYACKSLFTFGSTRHRASRPKFLFASGSTKFGASGDREGHQEMPGKKIGPRSAKGVLIKMTPDEHAAISKVASETGLAVAVMMRRLALGYRPESIVDIQTMLELIRVRGDLGRLGGLLKLWLVEQPGVGAPEMDVRQVLNRALDLQGEVTKLLALLETITGKQARKTRAR
jgi:hypothetical protein